MHGDSRRLGYGGGCENKNEKAERKDSLSLQTASYRRMYRQQLKWCCTIISTILCDCSVTLEIRIHGLEVEKQSKTKMDTEVDKPHPMPERKGKMVLDESSTTEVEKQSKTKMDTEVDEPLPMPERKEYKIYLDRKHEDGLPSAGKRYLESEEAWLAYHTKFLEKVFGSCASEMIEPSFGVTGIFFALLTEEELKQLGGMDGVKIFEEKNYRCEYF
ncbi:hypothetical protein RHGRI_022192 [Rhododendron griersonianum]|uniref:Uncharacterized protein n=1 Tax=Rhododendron griersonianum TaxID=479676 RepID=A0AAV6JMY3_9ERIC|nr:hypothetical protein RHGRI_022192 [Rhododendron griersonianum]